MQRSLTTLAGLAVLMLIIAIAYLSVRLESLETQLEHMRPVRGAASAVPLPVVPRANLSDLEKSTISLFSARSTGVVNITSLAVRSDPFRLKALEVPRGTGSGFIWDESGHVVTNFHVIQGASEATVRLADGRDYKAALVGVSPAHDIAVLRIGVGFQRPPPVPVGTSADLKVGQKVFAIGNPFGLDWTLTTGVVSALDRSLGEDNGAVIEHLIQTDAAINPGNSGGPLLDSAGRLIGINTAIYSPSGGNAGIGFAVPVDTVNRVVPQLVRHGRYLRPALGIEADDGLNERLKGLLKVEGVVILRVPPGSAAATAGLRGATLSRDGALVPGDIITAIDGKPVDSLGKLLARLDDYKVGDTVQVKVLRDGKDSEVAVALQPGG